MTGIMDKAHGMNGYMRSAFMAAGLVLGLAVPGLASQDVELKVTKGVLAMRANDLTAAEELFQAALTQDATNEDAHYFLGQTYNRLQRYPEAVSHLTQVDAALWPVSFDLGLAYYGSGEYAPAADWLDDAVERKENLGQAQFYLGLASYKLGKYKQAQDALVDATRAGLSATLDSYAMLYLALAQQRLGDAQASATTAGKLREQYPTSEAAALAANLGEDLSAPTPATTAPGSEAPTAGESAAEKPEKDRFMRFKLILGTQYDSNPALVQDDISARQFADPDAVEDPAAWRSTYDFGLGFNFVRRPKFRWSVDGSAYMNTHYGFLDKAYLNFAREEARTDFGVYIGKWALLFGGGYNAVQSELFNFEDIEEKAKNAVGGQDTGLSSFLWQPYSEGIAFYATYLYQLGKQDSVRGGIDGSIDTFAVSNTDSTARNPRDGVLIRFPVGYTRILLPKLGLAVDADLTPGFNHTVEPGSQYAYWMLGLDTGVRINPVKVFHSGLTFSYEHRGYQSEMVDPLVAAPQFRSDNDVSAMLYAGIKAGAFVLNASSRLTTHRSNMDIFAYKRAIHGFSLGFKL